MRLMSCISISCFSATLIACSGGGGSSSPPVTVAPPPPPPPPVSQAIDVEIQKTQGNHTLVFPGDSLSVTCSPDTAGTQIAWTANDSDVGFASNSALSTTASIAGTTARRIDITCSDANSNAAGSAPVFVNLPTETKFRINPVIAGQIRNQQESNAGDASATDVAPGCIDESAASLGADYLWVNFEPEFDIGCYGAFAMSEDNGEDFLMIAKLRTIFGLDLTPPAFGLYGDVVLEEGRTYTFSTVSTFDNGRITVGGNTSGAWEARFTLTSVSAPTTLRGVTYTDCIDYELDNPPRDLVLFYCDSNQGTGDARWVPIFYPADAPPT